MKKLFLAEMRCLNKCSRKTPTTSLTVGYLMTTRRLPQKALNLKTLMESRLLDMTMIFGILC